MAVLYILFEENLDPNSYRLERLYSSFPPQSFDPISNLR